MEAGAEIEINSGKTFFAYRCHFQGRQKMWKSITCKNGSKFWSYLDTIQDAEFGIHALNGSAVELNNNHFYRNYVGLYVDIGAVNNHKPMIGNRFYTNGSFLPPFVYQKNVPGSYGYCGVLMKNAVFTVGSASAVNYFYDLYNGVIGINSDVSVTKADIRDLISIRSRLLTPRKFTYPDGDGIFASNSIVTVLNNTISGTNGAITDHLGKSLIAYDNILSNTVSGIYCAYPKLECYMDKKQIKEYNLYGIGVVAPSNKISLLITRTDTFRSATSLQTEGSTAIYLENVVGLKLGQVQMNKMILDQYAYGVVLRSCQNIGLQENFSSYTGITKRNGIGLTISNSNVSV